MENKLSYHDLVGKTSLKSHSDMLKLIKENFEKAIKLDNNFALFFDTNVLLRTYSISFKARKKLLKFYDSRKDNIHLTNQVQIEFIKNREEVINKFFDNVTNKIPNDFRSDVISQIGSYLDKNKIIFKDYENFESELDKIKNDCEKLYNKLLDQVEKQKKENSNLILEDPQISILENVICLDPLSEDDIKTCRSDYDNLAKGIDSEKINSIMNKSGKVFPGLGDLKEKPENPYGDYIIFHEMMKFAKDNKKNIIFLTYDTTKGDWMKKDKSTHIHYIENFYLNTGQLIFILDAERIFEELLDISFKSLIQIKEEVIKKSVLLTVDALTDLLVTRFSGNKADNSMDSLIDLYNELLENGYTTMDTIINDLNRADDAFEELIKVKENSVNRFSQIGNLRIRMELANKNYRLIDPTTKVILKIGRDFVKAFDHLVK